MAEPTCPGCSCRGVEHIVSKESAEKSRQREAWFHVVYCDQCGHVYDILNKHVFMQQAKPIRFVMPDKS